VIGVLSLALAVTLVAATSLPTVHTALGELHACLPLDKGYVVGSTGGLVELDADLNVTRVRTVLDGLPGTRVDTLVAAGEDVWVGTEAGLVRLRERVGALVVSASWSSPPVRVVTTFRDATYVGTWGGGVLRVEGDVLVPVAPKSIDVDVAAQRVTAFAEVAGVLYVGTGAGVMKLVAGQLVATGLELPNVQVWALSNAQGKLWIGTLAGLAVVDNVATRSVRTVNGSDTRALVEVGAVLYAGTYGDGLVAVGAARGDDAAAFVDGMGVRGDAMCAVGPGVLRVKTGAAAWREVALTGLPSNDIAALAVAGERVWIGTFDSGLARLDNGKVEAVDDRQIDPHINALAVEHGRLWIGTARGLFVDDGTRVRRIGRVDGLPDEEIHALAPLAAGGVAIGTGRGAVIWRGGPQGRGEVIGKKQGLPGQAVWAVAEDRAGRLWIGTSAGLILWQGDGRWERLSVASEHLADDWVTALAVDPTGDVVWVGTYAGGVSRIGLGAARPATQLGGGHVNFGGLSVHRGTLYAATMEGLQVASDGAWKTSSATLGVDVTGVVADSGGIWVATRRGIARLAR